MTIYDIAREAGVSASTVSRVINNKPGIKESTRRRVQALLEKYNYTPDAAARGLVTQASRFIGILIEDIRVSHHTESAYVIEQEMTRQGYTCITFSTGPLSSQKARYIELLEQRRVEGAILIGSMFGTPEVQSSVAQHLAGIPVVVVNGVLELPNAYSVLIDEERGTEDCVDLLCRKGRRQLAYLMDVASPANEKKNRGFCTGMLRNGLETQGRTIRAQAGGPTDPRSTLSRGRAETAELLRVCPQVDGILCATDMLALGCIQELACRGISVPGQVAVMGVDNTLCGQLCTPALSTLDNRPEEVSLAAARMMLALLQGQPVSRRMMLLTGIIQRQTT